MQPCRTRSTLNLLTILFENNFRCIPHICLCLHRIFHPLKQLIYFHRYYQMKMSILFIFFFVVLKDLSLFFSVNFCLFLQWLFASLCDFHDFHLLFSFWRSCFALVFQLQLTVSFYLQLIFFFVYAHQKLE